MATLKATPKSLLCSFEWHRGQSGPLCNGRPVINVLMLSMQEDRALRSMEERMVPLGQHLAKVEREVKKLQASLEDTEVCPNPFLPTYLASSSLFLSRLLWSCVPIPVTCSH